MIRAGRLVGAVEQREVVLAVRVVTRPGEAEERPLLVVDEVDERREIHQVRLDDDAHLGELTLHEFDLLGVVAAAAGVELDRGQSLAVRVASLCELLACQFEVGAAIADRCAPTLGVPVETGRNRTVILNGVALVESRTELVEVDREIDRLTQGFLLFRVAADERVFHVEAAEDEVEKCVAVISNAAAAHLGLEPLGAGVERLLVVLRGDLGVSDRALAEAQPHRLILDEHAELKAIEERHTLTGSAVQTVATILARPLILGRVQHLVIVRVAHELEVLLGNEVFKKKRPSADWVEREILAVHLDGLTGHDRGLEHAQHIQEAVDRLHKNDLELMIVDDAEALDRLVVTEVLGADELVLVVVEPQDRVVDQPPVLVLIPRIREAADRVENILGNHLTALAAGEALVIMEHDPGLELEVPSQPAVF